MNQPAIHWYVANLSPKENKSNVAWISWYGRKIWKAANKKKHKKNSHGSELHPLQRKSWSFSATFGKAPIPHPWGPITSTYVNLHAFQDQSNEVARRVGERPGGFTFSWSGKVEFGSESWRVLVYLPTFAWKLVGKYTILPIKSRSLGNWWNKSFTCRFRPFWVGWTDAPLLFITFWGVIRSEYHFSKQVLGVKCHFSRHFNDCDMGQISPPPKGPFWRSWKLHLDDLMTRIPAVLWATQSPGYSVSTSSLVHHPTATHYLEDHPI